MAACPDENALQLFVAGRLDERACEDVEDHLGGCDECRAVVLSIAPPIEDTASASPSPRDVRLARGDAIGRYLVLDRLGQGGMGVVHSAYDPELDRRVAIKLIRPERAAESRAVLEQLRQRLLREALAMARLGHPNVVTVYDVGTRGDQVWVAMELVEGETLATWMRRPHPPREVLAMFVAAGRGLEAAHAAGIVHRDFKPDNVLVGSDRRPRVTDFGLARAIAGEDDLDHEPVPECSPVSSPGASPTPLPAVTETGILVGTPDYMAPEQLRLEPVAAAADQFAYCVALWEALAGERPFAGLALDARQRAIEAGPPAPRRALSSRVARALARGLAARPSRRWPSMTALLARLEIAGRSRLRRAAPIVAAVALAATVALAIAGWERREPPPTELCGGGPAEVARVWDPVRRARLADAMRATRRADATAQVAAFAGAVDRTADAWLAMDRESCRATRVYGTQSQELLDLRTACLGRALTAIDATLDVATTNAATADARALSKLLPGLGDCADVEGLRGVLRPPADPAVRAIDDTLAGLLARDRALRDTGDLVSALTVVGLVDAAARAHGLVTRLPEVELDEAQLAIRRDRIDDAIATFDRAAVDALVAKRDDLLAEVWLSEADVTGNLRNDTATARVWLELAGGVIARLPAARARGFELARQHMFAVLSDATVDLHGIEVAARAELEMVARGAPDLEASEQALTDLAIAFDREHLPADALRLYTLAIAVALSQQPSDQRSLGTLYYDRGMVFGYTERYAEAERDLRRGLELDGAMFAPEHPDTLMARISLGDVLERLGRFDEAAALLEPTLPMVERHRAELDVGVPEVLRLWAIAEAGRGHTRAALDLVARWQRETGQPLPDELRAIGRGAPR